MTRPLPERRRPLRLFWMQSGGCGGCTLSLIGAEGPDLLATFEAANIEVLWHPSLSEQSGRAVIDADRIRIPVNATAKRVTGLNAAGTTPKSMLFQPSFSKMRA